MRRRVLAIAWTLPEWLRCEIVRPGHGRWQVEVWRDTKRLRFGVAPTIDAVHGLAQQWREEFRAEIDARRSRGDSAALARLRRPRPAKATVSERRVSGRPRHGEEAPCADCGAVSIFCDRFTLVLPDGSRGPGWLCQSPTCGHRVGVRAARTAASLSALIVDDNAARRARYRSPLHALGAATQEIEDGRQALAVALAAAPTMLVTDVRLASFSAWSLCELLKRHEHTQSIRVILVARNVSPSVCARADSIGVDLVVKAPLTDEALRLAVLRLTA